MKILFLSNFYPPASRGGYEEWCKEVLAGLRARSHDVRVLTSNFGGSEKSDPAWVSRDLYLEMEFAALRNAFQFFTSRKRRESENLRILQAYVEKFQPEAIMIWGMWNLPRSLACLAEGLMPGRVIYYMGDYWPSLPGQYEEYWDAPAQKWISNIPKAVLRPIARNMLLKEGLPAPKLERVLFPSEFMMQEFKRLGFVPECTEVVHGAIETEPYLLPRATDHLKDYCSLLYIGRLAPEKGVHTMIEAVDYLVHTLDIHNVKLTIVGNGEPVYTERLQQLAHEAGLSTLVTFLPAQPKAALPAIYHEADVLVFPSIWAEPFGRVIVEGMASGLAVAGTRVGGAAELLIDEETALTFLPEDPAGLAKQLKRLIEAPSLRRRLGEQARRWAVNRFDIEKMTTGIESHLKEMAAA